MNDLPPLSRLAAACGVELEYTDIWGEVRRVSPDTQRALLTAMGLAVKTDADVSQTLAEHELRAQRRYLPPVKVVREGAAIVVGVTLPSRTDQRWKWRLRQEDGRETTGAVQPAAGAAVEEVGGERRVRMDLGLPPLPMGYHWFEISGPEEPTPSGMRLIVAPDGCYVPESVRGEGRLWGPGVQLYSLRSRRNWGAGDFSDLYGLTDCCAAMGADITGLSPLHALFPHNPAHASPYSPSSRLFHNFLYLDVEAIPEFLECEAAREAVATREFQQHLQVLRNRDLVDWPGLAAAKLRILDSLYTCFRERHLGRDTERGRAFRVFQDENGETLYRHALFEALQENFHREDPRIWGWPAWPVEFRDPASPQVAEFGAKQRERLEFYEYLQWNVELQLSAVGQHSLSLGLGVGLYADLAVSVDVGGAEAWMHQGLYATQAAIGAPPDDFNLNGQNWGLPPPIPERQAEAGYAPFAAVLRRCMRYAGVLRVDHVMSLMRLFWVPAGAEPAQGAYVRYPLDDLLGVLALESRRGRCMVVGEDLGTVPDGLRERLAAAGVFSQRVFYFEKDAEGHYQRPGEFPAHAQVSVGSHDLPTLTGFWRGRDLQVRSELALFPSQQVRDSQILERSKDRAAMLLALEQESLLPDGITADPASAPDMTPALCTAVHSYLARAPSKLLMVQLEDVLGQVEQMNLPGTTDQHPNWRRKLPLYMEELLTDGRVQLLADTLRRERGIRPPAAPAFAPPGQPPPASIPRATYRLQFNADFTFDSAVEIVPYLNDLGISHCYASPYLRARAGSHHGYDIIEHNSLNPELGGDEAYGRFVAAMHQHRMGQILDIVPNHMGVGGSDNAWWLDLLENGPASPYADFFDVDWRPAKDELRGKVLLPTLGDYYGVILENGELRLVFDAERGEFSVYYYEHRFPIDPGTYSTILGHHPERLVMALGPENPMLLEFQALMTAFEHLPARREARPHRVAERDRDKEIRKQHLAGLCASCGEVKQFVEGNVRELNGRPGDCASFDLLHRLLELQAYRLAYWRVASDEINYRRFFDINDLAGLRMENPQVFEATHRLVFELIQRGDLDGLRIDHPDGLYDPLQYYQTLVQHAAQPIATAVGGGASGSGRSIYIVVEKILASYEHLPEDWPVHGTTGYEFANQVNGLLVYCDAEHQMDSVYAQFIGRRLEFDELLYERKKLIMKVALASELNVLANQLNRLSESDRRTRDFTLTSLRDALLEIVACFPIYRTYVTSERVSPEDERYVDWAVTQAKNRSLAVDISIFDFIRCALLGGKDEENEHSLQAFVAFAMKFQQYSSPVMAKGLEDTAFYSYNRLVSLNEVGGDPRRFGLSVAAFHRATQERQRHWPQAMLNTSTHDSKRSEDVRARINVLSEMAADWRRQVMRWVRINRAKKRLVDGAPAPSRNDEYLFYQTLIGAWPADTLDQPGFDQFRERIASYMLKAAREAKVHTSWINPKVEYEEALLHFVRATLAGLDRNPFLVSFVPFQRGISHFGFLNSLSQVLLKLTAPGVPDIYQGCEIWNLSLVDPDNRRPVDYRRRQEMLSALREFVEVPDADLAPRARGLAESMEDGRIKLYLTWRTLGLRREMPKLFQDGAYVPLAVEGARADHLCAFARTLSEPEQSVVVVAPRWYAKLLEGHSDALPLGGVWSDTVVVLPQSASRYVNALTGESVQGGKGGGPAYLSAANVLGNFPVALLRAAQN